MNVTSLIEKVSLDKIPSLSTKVILLNMFPGIKDTLLRKKQLEKNKKIQTMASNIYKVNNYKFIL